MSPRPRAGRGLLLPFPASKSRVRYRSGVWGSGLATRQRLLDWNPPNRSCTRTSTKTVSHTLPYMQRLRFLAWFQVHHRPSVTTCMSQSLSCVRLFAAPWTVARQALLSTCFSRQEHWSGLPFPSPGDPPNPGTEPRSPALQADSLLSEPPGKPFGNGLA